MENNIANNNNRCTYCGEDISKDARRCPYCGSFVDKNYNVNTNINLIKNQTGNTPEDQPAAQAASQSFDESMSQTNQPLNQSIDQPLNKPLNQMNQPINQPVNQPVNQQMNRPMNQQKNQQANLINNQSSYGYYMPLSNRMKVFITTISTFIPWIGQLIGLIAGIVYVNSEDDKDRKSFGFSLMVSSLIIFVINLFLGGIVAIALYN